MPGEAKSKDRMTASRPRARLSRPVWLREEEIVMEHNSTVFTAVYSPDGKQIVTASDDRTARLWDAESGRPMAIFGENMWQVTDANFSRNGREILTASLDGTAAIYRIRFDEILSWAKRSQPVERGK